MGKYHQWLRLHSEISSKGGLCNYDAAIGNSGWLKVRKELRKRLVSQPLEDTSVFNLPVFNEHTRYDGKAVPERINLLADKHNR